MSNPMLFEDRADAGRKLAAELAALRLSTRELKTTLVMAIPSGGVPVGKEIARALGVPLELLVVRKIQVPWSPETGLGSVTSTGSVMLNPQMLPNLRLSDREIHRLAHETHREVRRRESLYGQEGQEAKLQNKTVILVDDGLATGYTMLAAIESVRVRLPRRMIAAVPTATEDALTLIRPRVRRVVCLYTHPSHQPFAVAASYEHWQELSDREVLELLRPDSSG